MKYPQLTIVDHPLIAHSLTIIRDRSTKKDEFRRHATIVAKLVLIEATKSLATTPQNIQTPIIETVGSKLVDSVVLVPVLRAGLSMLFAAQELLPQAAVGFVGLARDEETAIAKAYYQKLPQVFHDSQIFILDPMLATGGSLLDTIHQVQAQGGKQITAVTVVAAPEGVALVSKLHPEVAIVTAALDQELNEKKYIVPGLGDFGDRYFGT